MRILANLGVSKTGRGFDDMVKCGEKTIEGRLKKGKWSEVKKGDEILFNESLVTEVISVREYSSFEEMLRMEGLSKVLPGYESIEDGVTEYRRFFSEDEEKRYGVIAIEVTLA